MGLSQNRIFLWQQDFEDVLTYIEDALEQDVEQLSEHGTDRMFHNLSVVFRNLFLLLERVVNPMQADELVSHFCITRLTTQICYLTELCSVLLIVLSRHIKMPCPSLCCTPSLGVKHSSLRLSSASYVLH